MSWQKCPICYGTGYGGLKSSVICPTCNGQRIIHEVTGLPPNYQANKKQIIDAREDGAQSEHRAKVNGKADKSSLDYYNETYKPE